MKNKTKEIKEELRKKITQCENNAIYSKLENYEKSLKLQIDRYKTIKTDDIENTEVKNKDEFYLEIQKNLISINEGIIKSYIDINKIVTDIMIKLNDLNEETINQITNTISKINYGINELKEIKKMNEEEFTSHNFGNGYSIEILKEICKSLDDESEIKTTIENIIMIMNQQFTIIDVIIEGEKNKINTLEQHTPGSKFSPDDYKDKSDLFDLSHINTDKIIKSFETKYNVTETFVKKYLFQISSGIISFEDYKTIQDGETEIQINVENQVQFQETGIESGDNNDDNLFKINFDETDEINENDEIEQGFVLDPINMNNHFFKKDVVETSSLIDIVELIKLTSFKDVTKNNVIIDGFEILNQDVTDMEVLKLTKPSNSEEIQVS